MKKFKILLLVPIFVSLLFLGKGYAATTYTLIDTSSIVPAGNPGNAAELVSDVTEAVPWGSVEITPTSPIAWADFTTLSLDYNVTDDSCGGGSPRVSIMLDTNNDGVEDGYVHVALGPSPSFTGCLLGWNSTGNLIGNTDVGRYDYSQFGGSPFTTYANAPLSVLDGDVVGILLVADGSWSAAATGGDGEQTVLVDNIAINSDVTTFDIVRFATITDPTSGEDVIGLVEFNAYLVDDDVDFIQWAVRKDSCSGETVFGNVDGFNDVATIDTTDLNYQTFSFTGDMSTMEPGVYCFVYNPREDAGESGIRETVLFDLLETPLTQKDQCKEGGWMYFVSKLFKNQGDCVSYVQSNENASGNRKDN